MDRFALLNFSDHRREASPAPLRLLQALVGNSTACRTGAGALVLHA